MQTIIDKLKVLLALGIECLDRLSKSLEKQDRSVDVLKDQEPESEAVVTKRKNRFDHNYDIILTVLRNSKVPVSTVQLADMLSISMYDCELKPTSLYSYLNAMVKAGEITYIYSEPPYKRKLFFAPYKED